MSSWKSLVVLPLALALALPLTACSTGGDAQEITPPDKPTPVETPSASPGASDLSFTMPEECATIVPRARLDAFAASGLVLLGGPDGKYGNDYLADATPEEQAGGISCIWGFADSEVSSVTISVAPLSPATRPDVVDSFSEQGLNEDVVDGAATFGVQGDKQLNPAVFNVLRAESWISVIETIGGPVAYTEAVAIAGEIYSTVYREH
ncbi:MAG: hypothetical protein JWM50_1395 [Microbacteriaceae bacterium]|jgi:hypothetical protein|nr:hypothetical protein [Microbacteriaceae bacterium]